MGLLAALAVASAVCLLGSIAHEDFEPARKVPIVLPNTCLPEEQLADRAVERDVTDTLSGIASSVTGGRRLCLDSIYLLAYTSGERFADSSHPHNFEVVALNESRQITLPEKTGDYETHRGDIWKLSITEDLGFPPYSCVRLCNIDSISIVEGGTNGWHIDSVLSFGCISGTGCTQITQDIDVNRWVDGNSPIEGRERLTLTKISNTPCAM